MVTEGDKKLFELVRAIDDDFDYDMCIILAGRQYGTTEEVIRFIEENPTADSNALADFVFRNVTVTIVEDDDENE